MSAGFDMDALDKLDCLIVKHSQCGCTRHHTAEPAIEGMPLHQTVTSDSVCAPCKVAWERARGILERDHRAQSYLTRKMVDRFQNSRREAFRRWAHNALHRAQYALGHKFCLACNMLTHNRLEPKPLDHVRPMSHEPPA